MKMQNERPTDGPWREETGGEIVGDEGGNSWVIARLTYVDNPNINQKANGRLITACPELLMALRMIESCPHIRKYLTDKDPQALVQVQKAIVSAIGL